LVSTLNGNHYAWFCEFLFSLAPGFQGVLHIKMLLGFFLFREGVPIITIGSGAFLLSSGSENLIISSLVVPPTFHFPFEKALITIPNCPSCSTSVRQCYQPVVLTTLSILLHLQNLLIALPNHLLEES